MPSSEILAVFHNHFGHGPVVLGIAPARVNLIGEHTDYNDGFVFPVAIDRYMKVAARRVAGPTRLYSRQARDAEEFRSEAILPGTLHGWGRYPAGVAWALRRHGRPVCDVEAVVDSDIPMGSGVSSSAALELAFGAIWNTLGRLGLDLETLAHVAKLAENEFVGVNCGIMDQMASAMGKAGNAVFLDTRSLAIEYVPLPPDLAIVLCDTHTPRSLSGSAYNERRAECEEAGRILGVEKLRDANIAALNEAKSSMSEKVYRRARHVITENQRCLDFRAALRERNVGEIGRLMRESHQSLRDDYEVSSPALDAMAGAAQAAPGAVGARMTGAGFGGACVALVESSQVDAFSKASLTAYRAATGLEGSAMVCQAVAGAHALKLG